MTAAELVRLLVVQSWQLAATALVVGIIAGTLARHRPHLAHLLWLVVLLKCFTPPWLASPTSAFGRFNEPAPPAAPAPARTAGVTFPDGRGFVFDDASPTSNAAPASPPAPPLPIPKTAPASWRPAPQWIVALWLCGAALLVVWLAAKALRLRRELREHARGASAELQAQVDQLAARIGLRRRVRALVHEHGLGPAAFDGIRPTIVLPADLVERAPAEQLQHMAAHELAHLRRGDFWIGLCQLAAQAVWWFHPLVWWANRQMRRAREMACDAEALASGVGPPADYARTLLAVLDWQRAWQPHPLVPGVLARDATTARLAQIMRPDGRHRRRASWGAAALAALLAAIVLPGAAPPQSRQDNAAAPEISLGELVALPSNTYDIGGTVLTLDITALDGGFPAQAPEPAASPAHVAAAAELGKLGARVHWGGGPVDDPIGYHVTCDALHAVTDAWLPLLKQLDRVGTVGLYGRCPPEVLRTWSQLPAVKHVFLEPASDELVAALADWPALKYLHLSNVNVRRKQDEPPPPVTAPSVSKLARLETLTLQVPAAETVAALQPLAGLKRLYLHVDHYSPELMAALGTLTSLDSLSLSGYWDGGAPVDDARFAPLANLRWLRELDVHFNRSPDAQPDPEAPPLTLELPWIESLESLERFNFSPDRPPMQTKVSQRGWQRVAALPNLRVLVVWNAIDRALLGGVAQSRSLRGLQLLGETEDIEALAELGALRQLNTLYLSLNKTIDDRALRGWENLTQLNSLVIEHDCQISDESAAALRAMTKMRKLKLEGQTRLTDDGLAALANMPDLEYLQLTAPRATDRGLAHLADKPSLRHVSLRDMPIRDEGLAILARLPALDWLDLSNARTTGAGLSVLPEDSALQTLILAGNPVDAAGAAQIARAHRLTSLNLNRTRVDDAAVAALRPLVRLQSLDLSRSRVTSAALEHLLHLPLLRSALFSFTKVTQDDVNAFTRRYEELHRAALDAQQSMLGFNPGTITYAGRGTVRFSLPAGSDRDTVQFTRPAAPAQREEPAPPRED